MPNVIKSLLCGLSLGGPSRKSPNPYEEFLIEAATYPDNIDVMFESIGGLINIKEELSLSVILPLKSPTWPFYGPLKGVLLYGPPGTGKTMLVQAIAKESGAVCINVKLSKLMSNVLTDSHKFVNALFTLACKVQPAIIFIDEVDDFLGKRRSSNHEIMVNMKSEFMSMWNGFKNDKRVRVMILAVTNRPLSELDVSVLGTFSQRFEIKIPNRQERAEILEDTLNGEMADDTIDYYYLAGLCEGCTGSDLVDQCNKAYQVLTKRFAKKNKNPNKARSSPRLLAQADLEKAFLEYKKTKTAAYEYSRRNAMKEYIVQNPINDQKSKIVS